MAGASTAVEHHGEISGDGPNISWPVNRPSSRGPWTPQTDQAIRAQSTITDASIHASSSPIVYRDLLPGRRFSLSGIALRAFCLGITLGLCSSFTFYLVFIDPRRIWRPFFFLSILSVFHFLEFWTHAMYNLPQATTQTFLLSSNGRPYMAANAMALLETILLSTIFPEFQARFASSSVIMVGLVLIVMGQTVRTVAMKQAGMNFNHHVQTRRNEGHVLVTNGVYAILRHPSYFGFYWWALGSQIVLGNAVSTALFAFMLWMFFSKRIKKEEAFLIGFFGDDYIEYRARTHIGIPLVGLLEVPRRIQIL